MFHWSALKSCLGLLLLTRSLVSRTSHHQLLFLLGSVCSVSQYHEPSFAVVYGNQVPEAAQAQSVCMQQPQARLAIRLHSLRQLTMHTSPMYAA